MEVLRIAHAGLVVAAGKLRCLVDPVLVQPFECGSNVFHPPVRIDPAQVAGQYNLVVLSHEHMDHFDVRSLDLLDRDCPVVYPRGCELVQRALRVLGFQRTVAVTAGETVTAGDVVITFTPSDVAFPELGMLFSHGGQHVWNTVDTEVGPRALELVRRRAARVDVLLALYQVLHEEELGCDALGAAFPYDAYAQRVAVVQAVGPRCVVPSSCGYRYATLPWQNARGFPVGERDFLDDLRRAAPAVRGVSLAPGAGLDVATLDVTPRALPFVHPCDDTGDGLVDWRPDRGVPPLVDEDPFGHGADVLRERVGHLLATEFIGALGHVRDPDWLARLGAAEVVWQLEVVYPDGTAEHRWLDFADLGRGWLDGPPRPPRMITSICASTVHGLRCGELTPYRAIFTRRVVLRLYQSDRSGIRKVGGLGDEPIARVLFPAAGRRYVDAELDRLGYAVGP